MRPSLSICICIPSVCVLDGLSSADVPSLGGVTPAGVPSLGGVTPAGVPGGGGGGDSSWCS